MHQKKGHLHNAFSARRSLRDREFVFGCQGLSKNAKDFLKRQGCGFLHEHRINFPLAYPLEVYWDILWGLVLWDFSTLSFGIKLFNS